MDVDIESFDPTRRGELTQLMNSVVLPRPIAWVTTLDADGVGNLAPFSYFNLVSSAPPVVSVAFSQLGRRDTLANIVQRREFVVNVVSHRLRHPMVASSAEADPDVDEAAVLGLATTPAASVTPPRLADAAVALECELHEVLPVYTSHLALGLVRHVHVDESVVRDGRVVPELLTPVARLGGSLYTTVTTSYRIDRPGSAEPELLRRLAAT